MLKPALEGWLFGRKRKEQLSPVENEEAENIWPSLNIGENTRGLSTMTGVPILIILSGKRKTQRLGN